MKKCKFCTNPAVAYGICTSHEGRHPDRFIQRAYKYMKWRVAGKHSKVNQHKIKYWAGLPILSREEFYAWSKSDSNFKRLYKFWASNNYEKRLAPSVNRINSKEGYVLSNIEWVTHGQNSGLASVTRALKNPHKKVIMELLGIGK